MNNFLRLLRAWITLPLIIYIVIFRFSIWIDKWAWDSSYGVEK